MNKRSVIIILIIIIILIPIGIYLLHKGQTVSPPPSNLKDTNNYATTTISIGQNVLDVQIADTEDKRTLGLGNRTSMPENAGMLFVFDHSDRYGFWMKDTLIPLDMIWLDQNKTIVDIKNDVEPDTFPTVFYPVSDALYVLELNANYAKNHQIKISDKAEF